MSNDTNTVNSASERAAIQVANHSVVLPNRRHGIVQNFLLIWLDADFDEFKDDYKNSLQHLRYIVATITTFTDVDECIDFLSDIEDEKAFLIVSGALGQHIVSEIHAWQQLQSIYVFCNNQSAHE
ncbi:unnamed protein product, partial [Rotaria sp. Silwood2]